LNQAKAKPNESIMIGDNYEADILGALDVGLEAILYNIHKLKPEANIKEVDTLLQLKNYL
jgi:putative hydrolase of the HAD superfamily